MKVLRTHSLFLSLAATLNLKFLEVPEVSPIISGFCFASVGSESHSDSDVKWKMAQKWDSKHLS